tara:strand:+ start:11162 stop:11434 length:273 start_codon:yes stop_codon:yes gene_type:complete
MQLSRHAQTRLAQRAIPPVAIDWLQQFGQAQRTGDATRYAFDKKGRRRLEGYLGSIGLKSLKKVLDAYMVISDDETLITAGYRTQRFQKL